MNQFTYLTETEYQRLQNLAAYCGYLRHQDHLAFPDPAALIRALASLPPEKWNELARLISGLQSFPAGPPGAR